MSSIKVVKFIVYIYFNNEVKIFCVEVWLVRLFRNTKFERQSSSFWVVKFLLITQMKENFSLKNIKYFRLQNKSAFARLLCARACATRCSATSQSKRGQGSSRAGNSRTIESIEFRVQREKEKAEMCKSIFCEPNKKACKRLYFSSSSAAVSYDARNR